MPQPSQFATSPEAVGIDAEPLEALLERFEHEVRDDLLPSAQVAIARHGKIAAMRTIGSVRHDGREAPATDDTLYAVFSITKGITSAAAWLLVESGDLDPEARVADLLPEFGTNGKESVRVEHLFTHTAGFPYAPFSPLEWPDRDARAERFRRWRLDWEPGSRFEYHPTASMWVVAALIEKLSGLGFAEFVRTRVARPLGLRDLHVGCPAEEQQRVADIVYVGDAPTAEELRDLGLGPLPDTKEIEAGYLSLNRSDVRAMPIAGGGAYATAGDVALFYQALLAGGRAADGTAVWKPETVEMVREVRTGELRDPIFGVLANRGLGLVIAGDETRIFRGFGTGNSPDAFGHNGAGGQIAWADPRTGISFAYCTNGFDRNPIRQGRRTISLSSLAAVCATE